MNPPREVRLIPFSSQSLQATVTRIYVEEKKQVMSICNWMTPDNFSSSGWILLLKDVPGHGE